MHTLRHRLSRLVRALVRARVRAQRGMTLLEIMIVLAILALVMGLLVGPKVMKMFAESKVDITKIKLKKYAYEAYPSWSASHPDKACPDKHRRSQRVHERQRLERLVGPADQDDVRRQPPGGRQGPRRDVDGRGRQGRHRGRPQVVGVMTWS